MKFGNFMPFETTTISYLLIYNHQYYQHGGYKNLWVLRFILDLETKNGTSSSEN